MLPKWCEKYSIHNATIDAQHKKLFELAANVEMMSDKPVHKGQVKFLLAEFFNYIKEHFSDEEAYMEKIGYPALKEHQKIHKSIISTMVVLIQNIKSTNDLKEKLNVIVSKWLLEHILQEDMKIEKWYQQHLKNIIVEERPIKEKETHFKYTCECVGKIHKVPQEIHLKIQSVNNSCNYKCKICQQYIKLKTGE